MTGLWLISYIALWIFFLVVALLLISVFYHLGVIYNKVENRLPPPTKLTNGETIPEIALQTPGGDQIVISQFLGVETAFVIISPGCSNCLRVLKAIATGDGFMKLPVQRMVIVSLMDITATLAMVRQAQLSQNYVVLVDTENILEKAWGIHATPVIVEVDNELKVSKQRAIYN